MIRGRIHLASVVVGLLAGSCAGNSRTGGDAAGAGMGGALGGATSAGTGGGAGATSGGKAGTSSGGLSAGGAGGGSGTGGTQSGSSGTSGNGGAGARGGEGGAPPSGAAGVGESGAAGADDPCASAIDRGPCTVPGASCGGENCTDACSFCNIMRCELGVWQRLEALPAPCFDCGSALRCQTSVEYCRIDQGTILVEECVPLPATCESDLTCACMETIEPDHDCTLDAPGELTLERCCG